MRFGITIGLAMAAMLACQLVDAGEKTIFETSFESGWDGLKACKSISRSKKMPKTGKISIKFPYANANGQTIEKSLDANGLTSIRLDFDVTATGDGNGIVAFGLTNKVSWNKLQVEICVQGTGDKKSPSYKISFNDAGKWKDAVRELPGACWCHVRIVAHCDSENGGTYDLYVNNMSVPVAKGVEFRYDAEKKIKYFYAECFNNKGTGSNVFLDDVKITEETRKHGER